MKLKYLGVISISVILLTACSGSAEEVSLGFLVLHSGAYEDRYVLVEGQVRGIDEPEHYWLEDDHYNRVGLSPLERVKEYRDQSVKVTGRFQVSQSKGRQLSVQKIEKLK